MLLKGGDANMTTLAERILQIRNEEKLSQSGFAQKLNLSQNFVWMVENGKREPSDRTIADICRVFGVDEVWLRTGVGEMSRRESREEAVAAVLGSAISGNSTPRDRLIRALARLPDDAFPLIEKFILDSAEAIQQDTQQE
nr:MAG TPA: helix-turn-helix domain protein [Caudoviricetes sp.]